MEYKKSLFPADLANAVTFLENNIYGSLSLKKVCNSLGSSQSTLNRLFKKYLGASPIEYFIAQKMLAAKEMLKNDKLSIKEIAETLGYSNQLYFSTEFKKRNGSSPREFRFSKKTQTIKQIR
jgi:AraC family transcriptional regulator of arabinose operon